MKSLSTGLRAVGLCLVMGAACLGGSLRPAAAEQLRLSPDQAREAAAAALVAGQPRDALTFAKGVLLAQPDDTVALFIKARALRELGEADGALEAAQAAWSRAVTPRERYFSAMMVAQMRSYAGHNGMAQLWLRRAAQIAPDDALKAVAVSDFRHVRRITPWRLAFDLFVTPSDNLNNATTEAQEVPGGLVITTPPLKGVRSGAGVTFRYTKPLAQRSRLQFAGFGQGSVVTLSEEAQAIPGADAADLSTRMLGGSLTWETISQSRTRLGSAGLSFSRHWQGGDPLADIARLDLSVQQALSQDWIGRARLGLIDTARHDSSLGDSQRRELSLALVRRMEQGALTLDVLAGETLSAAYNVGRQDATVGLRYSLSKPVLGMMPTVSVAYGAYDYDAPWIALPNGPVREDRTRTVGVEVLLPEMGAYGFAPEIGLSFTDRSSNYNLYDSRTTDLRLGLKSVF
ncbi:surface lipoprotein assembly modifier [Sagittula sp. S175]|uniref:surface lipoprotein assembly modifier n=1 Tax=Sagittula sp. S175 TaxID=3415129 RepID=UPI003C7B5A4A